MELNLKQIHLVLYTSHANYFHILLTNIMRKKKEDSLPVSISNLYPAMLSSFRLKSFIENYSKIILLFDVLESKQDMNTIKKFS